MEQSCRHHWIIDDAKSPTSKGVCKKCGEVRKDFDNGTQFADHARWNRTETMETREYLQPAKFRMHDGAPSL